MSIGEKYNEYTPWGFNGALLLRAARVRMGQLINGFSPLDRFSRHCQDKGFWFADRLCQAVKRLGVESCNSANQNA